MKSWLLEILIFKRCSRSGEGNKFKTERTVILVSHNLSSIVDLCDRAILLDEGKLLRMVAPKKLYLYTGDGRWQVIFKIFQSSVR